MVLRYTGPSLSNSGQQEGLSIINPDMVGNIKFPQVASLRVMLIKCRVCLI